jgi:hypothetical protein
MKTKGLTYELKLEPIISRFRPARPAPACQNHSDPCFSDPGDDEEIEFELFIKFKDKIISLPKDERFKELVEDIYGSAVDDVVEEARQSYFDRASFPLEIA